MTNLLEVQNMTCEDLYSNISTEMLSITEVFQNKTYSSFVELCRDFHNDFILFNDNLNYLENCLIAYNESSIIMDSAEILISQFKICQDKQEVFSGTFQTVNESIWYCHLADWIWGIFWLLFIEIIGNGCLFTTFAYERFGMDPQKRTVINQLLSQCCWIIIFFNITSFPIVIARRLFGPITPAFAIWFVINIRLYLCMISLSLSELIILKSMYVCKWSVMAMKDDNFISSIILRTNVLLSSLMTFQTVMLDDGTCTPIYKGLSNEHNFQLPTKICSVSLNL